jgi:PAB1-binding protein PBP1
LTLKDARDVGVPGAPLQDTFFIPAPNIASWKSGPADAHPNGDSFKTDVDITKTTLPVFGGPRHGRELQTWADDSAGLDLSSSIMGSPAAATTGHGDDVTFGAGSSGGWDQFAANERLFNVKTSFDEEAYTTRLDRSAPDFKERERKAQQIANEIMGVSGGPIVLVVAANVQCARRRRVILTLLKSVR